MAAKWLKKLGNTLQNVAPTLAGGIGVAVGGPVGGIVGPVLANLMRKVTGAPADDTDYEAMAERIMGSPELTLEMERLAIEREKMHFDLEASPPTRQSSRSSMRRCGQRPGRTTSGRSGGAPTGVSCLALHGGSLPFPWQCSSGVSPSA